MRKKKKYKNGGPHGTPADTSTSMGLQQGLGMMGSVASMIPGAGPFVGLGLSALGNMLPTAAMGGDLKVLTGASHENGGIPIDGQGNPTGRGIATAEAEGRESVHDGYIFSNSIKNPRTKNDFFTDSKKFEANENDDEISKRTKKMMLDRLQKEQEVERQKVLAPALNDFMKKFGGYLPDGDEMKIGKTQFGGASVTGSQPQYQMGGPLTAAQAQALAQNAALATPPDPMQPIVPQQDDFSNRGLQGPTTATPMESLANPDVVGDTMNQFGNNLQKNLPGLIPQAGALFNIGRGLGKKSYYEAQDNPRVGQVQQNYLNALDYNVDDKLRGITDSRARSLDLLRNMGGSRGGVFNRQLATQDQHDRGRERILSEQSRYQGGVYQNLGNAMMRIGESDRAQASTAADMKLRTDANARNLVGEGISQIGTNVQQQRNDMLTMELLKALYGHLGPMNEITQ